AIPRARCATGVMSRSKVIGSTPPSQFATKKKGAKAPKHRRRNRQTTHFLLAGGRSLPTTIIKICLRAFRRKAGSVDEGLDDHFSWLVGNRLEHLAGDVGLRRIRRL